MTDKDLLERQINDIKNDITRLELEYDYIKNYYPRTFTPAREATEAELTAIKCKISNLKGILSDLEYQKHYSTDTNTPPQMQ